MWMADSVRESAVPVVPVAVASALKNVGSGTVADRSTTLSLDMRL
jgi:hypothetical protein